MADLVCACVCASLSLCTRLCPGDEIRPMVRTMVNRVHRTVVFLSPAYITSPSQTPTTKPRRAPASNGALAADGSSPRVFSPVVLHRLLRRVPRGRPVAEEAADLHPPAGAAAGRLPGSAGVARRRHRPRPARGHRSAGRRNLRRERCQRLALVAQAEDQRRRRAESRRADHVAHDSKVDGDRAHPDGHARTHRRAGLHRRRLQLGRSAILPAVPVRPRGGGGRRQLRRPVVHLPQHRLRLWRPTQARRLGGIDTGESEYLPSHYRLRLAGNVSRRPAQRERETRQTPHAPGTSRGVGGWKRNATSERLVADRWLSSFVPSSVSAWPCATWLRSPRGLLCSRRAPTSTRSCARCSRRSR